MEKTMKLRRQVRGAMVYPAIVIVVFFAVLSILLVFVIPGFEKMFKDFGAKDELPVLTQIVMRVSRLFIGNILWLFLGMIGAFFGLSYYYRTPRGKRRIHKL